VATRVDAVLAGLTVAFLALGVSGLRRAGRWAARRRGAPWRGALGLAPSLLVVVVGAALPWLAEAWIGRDVTWRAAAYEWPAVVVFVGAALLAASATLLARAWSWRHSDDIVGETANAVRAVGRPVTVAVASKVDGDGVPAGVRQRRRGAAPRVSRLSTSVEQQHGAGEGVTVSVGRELESRTVETERRDGRHFAVLADGRRVDRI
jgi:hypothetical protein